MIKIKRFKNLISDIKSSVNNIDDSILTPTEEHAVKKLKDMDGIILVAVFPSSTSKSPDCDNYADINTTYFFIVEKTDYTSATNDSELDQYETLETIIADIREYIINNKEKCEILQHADLSSMHVDPEYNIFGGFNGYSLSLDFDTDGY